MLQASLLRSNSLLCYLRTNSSQLAFTPEKLRFARMASSDVSTAKIVTKDRIYEEHWQQPSGSEQPVLKVWNSLTRSKVRFVPSKSRHITWYNCGPTVYDASHMGHARNYVTQDYLRRILRDYFGYNIHFVMNITDIDDKIIIRARQQHLLTTYLNETSSLTSELISSVEEAWTEYFDKFSKDNSMPTSSEGSSSGSTFTPLQRWKTLQAKMKDDPVWLRSIKDRNEKFGLHVDTLMAGRAALEQAEQDISSGKTDREAAHSLLQRSKEIISVYLDKRKGDTVKDPAVFRSLAAYWEKAFFDDMERLHVERPTTLTRVSEYLPEITAFVERIVENQFAYETEDGSVYFDTKRFDGAKGKQNAETFNAKAGRDWCHTYAKLQPWSKGNKELLEEGEGSLSTTLTTLKSKKSPSDFALWKASKPGEPSWPSRWGHGRPGWHIECSVMASEVLGHKMDIHSGGVDLAFPHHDNELAQSEAYHDCRQWVNYFLHTGHLHIEGLKMSKSLKNFITIEEALEKSSARQLRLAFLMQSWNARMDFKESNMNEVKAIETMLNNFFTVVKALLIDNESRVLVGRHQYGQPEKDLMERLSVAQTTFHEHLCDSFNTPDAIQTVINLVSTTNVYLNSHSRSDINLNTLLTISEWVTYILRMLGLGEGPERDVRGKKHLGWGQAMTGTQNGSTIDDREIILMPYLRALSTFRDNVRKLAREGAKLSDILANCDQLRDQEMVDLGVALDDQEDGKALVKLVPAEQLRAARDQTAAIAREKAERKAESQAGIEAKRKEKLEKGRMPPQEMFKSDYTRWDEDGIPTHDQKGEEISKNAIKKLKKAWEQQQKLHEAFLAGQ